MSELKLNRHLTFIMPYILLLLLIYCFASLGFWQLDRAKAKDTLNEAYLSETSYLSIRDDLPIDEYLQIQTTGKYIIEKQIVIDNIIRNGQLGQMIITPFEINNELPWLLVNRGWVKKNINSNANPDININTMPNSVNGRSGNLPRMAIRDSEAFSETITWPAIGIYPTIKEIEILFGRKLFSYILLLDPEEKNGFQRNWEPRVSSTSTNYGYAIQWFLMCFGIIVVLIIKLKRLLIKNK